MDVTVIMLLIQFRLGPPGLSVPLQLHCAWLIGNRDSRNVDDDAKRGSSGRLVHSITRSHTYPAVGVLHGGQDASVFQLATGCSKKAFRP